VIGAWRVAGSYVEACSCEAVCPCRQVGSRAGGRSTYGTCDFVLGWSIAEGTAGAVSLAGLGVVMAGTYHDDEPGSPWRVVLYVDDRAESAQRAALVAIFLGHGGGDALRNSPPRSARSTACTTRASGSRTSGGGGASTSAARSG